MSSLLVHIVTIQLVTPQFIANRHLPANQRTLNTAISCVAGTVPSNHPARTNND